MSKTSTETGASGLAANRLRRVLIVDDHAATRESTAVFLRTRGWQTRTAADGREAVRAYYDAQAAGERFDVILLDLNMPEGESGGMAMLDLLEARPRPRLVVMSGDTENALLREFRYHGFDGRLTKPFTFDQLAAEVERVCRD